MQSNISASESLELSELSLALVVTSSSLDTAFFLLFLWFLRFLATAFFFAFVAFSDTSCHGSRERGSLGDVRAECNFIGLGLGLGLLHLLEISLLFSILQSQLN